jgi:hypothetical protein
VLAMIGLALFVMVHGRINEYGDAVRSIGLLAGV